MTRINNGRNSPGRSGAEGVPDVDRRVARRAMWTDAARAAGYGPEVVRGPGGGDPDGGGEAG